MKLENWAIITNNDGYDAPEVTHYFAIGNVYNHPTRPNGDSIRTAYLIKIDIDTRCIQTRNSTYELGTPKDDYLEYLKEHKPEWYKKLVTYP